MSWLGISEDRQPEIVLNSYFAHILESWEGSELFIDFTKLGYMNSSSVVPILHLIKKLNRSKIKTLVVYDDKSFWQRASFRAVSRLVEELSFDYVTVEAK
jgi:hypothetical protein